MSGQVFVGEVVVNKNFVDEIVTKKTEHTRESTLSYDKREAEDNLSRCGGLRFTGKDAYAPTLVLSCCDPNNLFDSKAKRDGVYRTVLIAEEDDLRS